MGVWGTDLFSDDVACDIRDHYRQLLEDSVEDSAATRLTLEKFEGYLEEPDSVALIAFAVTQSKLGRLEPDVRERALAVIDAGADLPVWERDNPKLLLEHRRFATPVRVHAHHAQQRQAPWKREGENVSSGETRADAFRRAQASPRRLRTG